MSKGKKRIVRLTESEMVDLIERIVISTKNAEKVIKESRREETRRKVMAEANKSKGVTIPTKRRK